MTAYESLLEKIKYTVRKYSMLSSEDSVLVGFSGGKDSVILLYSLAELSKEFGFSLCAFHVNHNIRGKEAVRDRDFCHAFCEKYGIPFSEASVNAVEYAENNKLSLEESARILRYGAFEDHAKAKRITKIATAHTSSDNLETLLFNFVRGTGTDGLKGIPPTRDNIIRPLIDCSTDEVLDAIKCLGLDFVLDSTNLDDAYTRNHIRLNVIPLLKEINPRLEESVSRMCDIVRGDMELIGSMIPKVNALDLREAIEMKRPLLSRTLMAMYKLVCPQGQLSKKHIDSMLDLFYAYTKSGCKEIKTLSLPEKTVFVVTPHKVYVEKSREIQSLDRRDLNMGLNVIDEKSFVYVSENTLEQSTCDLTDTQNSEKKLNVYNFCYSAVIKNTKKLDTIYIRGRLDGDSFKYSNMTKKVKKMMNEAKTPLHLRNNIPLFCDDCGIFWIPSFDLRDDMRPGDNDNKLHLYYFTQEKLK